MSREIKFRFYDTIVEQMLSMRELQQAGMQLEVALQGLNIVKVMQYTGLKDKNGKEIYEGDIIYFSINNGVGIEPYNAVVKWADNNPHSRFEYIIEYLNDGGFDSLSRASAYDHELVVYGNIYENPELLERE